MLAGIDGVLVVVVIGEGKLVVPVDFAIRRPDPTGPGAPCRDKLHWLQVMLDGRVAAFRRRGVEIPPPMVVADSWFGDSKLMRHMATAHQGTLLVEGKNSYVFVCLTDARSKGVIYSSSVIGHGVARKSWRTLCAAAATSPTYGAMTLIVVENPGDKQFYVMCLETAICGPRLIRRGSGAVRLITAFGP